MAGALVYVRLVQACEDDGVLWEHPADAGFRDLVRAARRRMFQVHFADARARTAVVCLPIQSTRYQILYLVTTVCVNVSSLGGL